MCVCVHVDVCGMCMYACVYLYVCEKERECLPPHLQGSVMIARYMKLQQGSALVHCSDGWDRTSQLTSLSQIMMDSYYRTMDGFKVTS